MTTSERKERHLEAARAWAARNPEKAAESKRRWLENNREKRRSIVRVGQRRRYWQEPEKVLEKCREWSAANPEKRRLWDKRNPEKHHCHQAVYRAIRKGLLVRQPCEMCGAKSQAHHDDYSKPLDVRWLCPKHHAEHHRMAA